jgi:glutamine cyclotransferase
MATIGFLGQRGTGAARAGQAASVPTYGYQVVRSYPHDRAAFTQGIIFRNGVFYEGTGLNGPLDAPQGEARDR